MTPMPTAKQDLRIPQGANFEYVIQLTDAPASISNYIVQMKARPWALSSLTYFDWSTSSAEISINDSTKQIVINVPAAKTAALDFVEGVYDIEMKDGAGRTWRLLEGAVYLRRESTR